MTQISALEEVTAFDTDDFFVIETDGGTKIIQVGNTRPLRNEFVEMTADDVNLDNDYLWIWDGTDNQPKRISVREIVFGNYSNEGESDDFTLDPAVHNIRTIQCFGTFTTGVITIDGTVDNGGCDYIIMNTTTADLTVTGINGMTLFVNGISGNGTVRLRRAATITCNNGGTQAIFSGG